MSTHDPIVRDHAHWRAFDAEDAKTAQLRQKASAHLAKCDAAEREHREAAAAYDEEILNAELEGRDPDPRIEHPGEYVAPKPLFARRRPIDIIMEREQQVEQMRRDWLANHADELLTKLTARDAALLAEASQLAAGIARQVADLEAVGHSWDEIRIASAAGQRPQPAPHLGEVRNILRALTDALGRSALPARRPEDDDTAPAARTIKTGNITFSTTAAGV